MRSWVVHMKRDLNSWNRKKTTWKWMACVWNPNLHPLIISSANELTDKRSLTNINPKTCPGFFYGIVAVYDSVTDVSRHLHYLLCLKGHSQLWDCYDLDTTIVYSLGKKFSPTWNQSSSRNCFSFLSVLLDFQSVSKTCFWVSFWQFILWYYFSHIWLKTIWIASLLYEN